MPMLLPSQAEKYAPQELSQRKAQQLSLIFYRQHAKKGCRILSEKLHSYW